MSDPQRAEIGRTQRSSTAAQDFARVAAPGAAVYTRGSLRLYDLYVHVVSNTLAWKCPRSRLLALYDQHVSGHHLDIGVGSGYFLDHCRFPVEHPRIALLDLNEQSLAYTSARIARYAPVVQRANVLERWRATKAPFDSIAMLYLLHCLPGDLHRKAVALRNAAEHLAQDGVLFGATILGKGVPHTAVGRLLLRVYNRAGIFGNADDSLQDLREALGQSFTHTEIQVEGCVALFTARGPTCTPPMHAKHALGLPP